MRNKTRAIWWLGLGGTAIVVTGAALLTGGLWLQRRLQPYLREQAVLYIGGRFRCDTKLESLRVRAPGLSPLRAMFDRGRGIMVHVQGRGLEMSRRPGDKPLMVIRSFDFDVDAGSLFDPVRKVGVLRLEGVTLNVPPKGERFSEAPQKGQASVQIETVVAREVTLALIPAAAGKPPLTFEISSLRLDSVGGGTGMRYTTELTNPKPRGLIRSAGSFGPWDAEEPGDTPLNGVYSLEKADMGVFPALAGTLTSEGSFAGSLSAIVAKGNAAVPNFSLRSSGNPIPLAAEFEVQVDGQNGNTVLQPVSAILGTTSFTTSGAILRKNGDTPRSISLDVSMPAGNLHDVLRLAARGNPMMDGKLALKTRIAIPPLSEKVARRLILDGTFRVDRGRFARAEIQEKIDSLSRRAQGQPKNEEISGVFSGMKGRFHLEGRNLTFPSLTFDVPGAAVNLAGAYSMNDDSLDVRGSLSLDAKVSETMTGWKHFLLKPADRFFQKNGTGTYLRIRIDGSAHSPHFGLDPRSGG